MSLLVQEQKWCSTIAPEMRGIVKKRSIFLIEFFISFLLSTFLILFLIRVYQETAIGKKELEKEKKIIFDRQRAQLRLKQLFESATFCEQKEPGHWAISYNNRIDLDPHFQGEREGTFSCSKDREEKSYFMFTTLSKEGSVRTEILLEGVYQFSFLFFDKTSGKWSATYPKNRPFMIQVVLSTREDSVYRDKNSSKNAPDFSPSLVLPLFL